MKKNVGLLFALLLLLSGCGTQDAAQQEEKVELTVFAAASMTETLTEIAELYKDIKPNVTLTYNFDSSGTLKTQIQEGAEADLFISAAQKQMNQLDGSQDKENNPDGLDRIDPQTRIDLLENRVVLVVPEGNPKSIQSFGDMATKLQEGEVLLAIGNEDVPVGQYTKKIFSYFALEEKDLAEAGVLTYGSNVKEVTTQVAEASVDAGIIYSTDAYSAKLRIVDEATKEMAGQIVYPAAVLKNSPHKEEAEAFLAFLQEEEAMDVFASVGFTGIR